MFSIRRVSFAAVIALAVAALSCPAVSCAAERGVVSHILIGVAPDASFAVSAEGSPLPGAPFASDGLGILTYDVDDAGLPPGPILIQVAVAGVSPTGPPIMQGVMIREISPTSVAVSWTTDRAASSQVRYGTKGDLDLSTAVDTARVTAHDVLVRPVVPRIQYSFSALSACGCDTAYCDAGVFGTSGIPALGPSRKGPGILRPAVHEATETTAVIRWATDRPCSTWVECGHGGDYPRSAPGDSIGDCGYEGTLEGLVPGTSYVFHICAVDASGAFGETPPQAFVTPDGPGDGTPGPADGSDSGARLSLSITPNPAASGAVLSFSLRSPGPVRARVLSASGRVVRELADRTYEAGPHAIAWDLRTGDGMPASSGAYLCCLETPEARVARKLVVVR